MIVGLLGGGFLLWLAIPQTVAAVQLLPGNPILDAIQRGAQPTRGELKFYVETRKAALEWTDSGRLWTDLGLAYLQLAELAGYRSRAGRIYLTTSRRTVRRGLSLAPSNPFAWSRLAFLRLIGDGPSPGVADAVMMSILTGPHERRLLESRIRYAVLLWDELSSEDRQLIKRQILWAERIRRRALLKMARTDETAMRVISSALADHPDRLKRFEKALER